MTEVLLVMVLVATLSVVWLVKQSTVHNEVHGSRLDDHGSRLDDLIQKMDEAKRQSEELSRQIAETKAIAMSAAAPKETPITNPWVRCVDVLSAVAATRDALEAPNDDRRYQFALKKLVKVG